MTSYLLTGAAGFIGYHVANRLLGRGDEVLGLDDLNSYYDPGLKEARLARLQVRPNFRFIRGNISDQDVIRAAFDSRFTHVIHLAAQAGVRYSLVNPHAYIDANLTGFSNVIEASRQKGVAHFVYASSSSVYGANTKLPFSVADSVDHPVSLYAATKKANELIAHSYSHLFALPTTGLRFFTVYGPWGRPDMSMYIFTQRIFCGEPIHVFNNGDMRRDFTYVDDIVEGVVRTADHVPGPRSVAGSTSQAPYRVYNIGNNRPVALLDMIATLERIIGKPAIKQFAPMQPGDVQATFADIDDIRADVGFEPSTSLDVGAERFVQWYREYHGFA
jgi:UDP-glucuronate 4-epimerase